MDRFDFYLDALDGLFVLQGRAGLSEAALTALPADEQLRFKAYLFLMESVNTTASGALQLFASNYYSDAFALLRMIYEAASLMYYGNQSPVCADEFYETVFKSGLEDAAHAKGEWALIRKAQSAMEDADPELVEVRKLINNFGAHVSRAKIVLGNVAASSGQTVSTVFRDNCRQPEFLQGLDLLFCVLAIAVQQYDRQAATYAGAKPDVADEIGSAINRFAGVTRPRLQGMVQPPRN
ncbi:MAG: hypothetical protein U1E29_15875 [Coriobacteriia bacterium]|nr:hypothetical protein [Coriobacteriia bacterium]